MDANYNGSVWLNQHAYNFDINTWAASKVVKMLGVMMTERDFANRVLCPIFSAYSDNLRSTISFANTNRSNYVWPRSFTERNSNRRARRQRGRARQPMLTNSVSDMGSWQTCRLIELLGAMLDAQKFVDVVLEPLATILNEIICSNGSANSSNGSDWNHWNMCTSTPYQTLNTTLGAAFDANENLFTPLLDAPSSTTSRNSPNLWNATAD